MVKLRVDSVGGIGLVRDTAPWKIPAEAWTTVLNAECQNGSVSSGQTFRLLELGSLIEGPLMAVHSYLLGDNLYYILCGKDKVWSYIDGAVYDITPTGFSFGSLEDVGWSFVVFNGILIINNGLVEPHFWPITGNDGPGTKLKPLSESSADWPVGQSCVFIKAFNNALFAGNITRGSDHYPYLVQFSDFAEPGSLPAEWTARSTNSAGDFMLVENLDPIVDADIFKDFFIIFKERAVHGIRFIGGNDVYQRFQINTTSGLLARNCLAPTDNFLFALTNDDIVVTRGAEFESVADQKLREYIFKEIDAELYKRCFVQHNPAAKEIWVLIPKGGQEGALAFIWDYKNNAWFTRECSGFVSGTNAFVESRDSEAWENLTEAWEDWGRTWIVPFLGEAAERLVFASRINKLDGSFTNAIAESQAGIINRDTRPAILERFWIPFPQGNRLDWESVKYVTEIWPKVDVSKAEEWEVGVDKVGVWLAGEQDQGTPKNWKKVGEFDPLGKRKKVGARISGRFVSLRFEFPAKPGWVLTGYDIEFKIQSKW